MSFGNQTVSFIVITESGTPDRFGMKTKVRTPTVVTGCRHRPLDAKEMAELETDVATQVWKTTAPPEAAAIAAASTGELLYDGTASPTDVAANRLHIIGGAKPFTDFANPFKVTILSQRQTG